MLIRPDAARMSRQSGVWWNYGFFIPGRARTRTGSGSSRTNGAAWCRTTRRDKTHNTDPREIVYPWHPWYGQHVIIIESVTKGGQTLLRCTFDGDATSRSREIPVWMFDRAVCCLMQLAPMPLGRVDDLRQVPQILGN